MQRATLILACFLICVNCIAQQYPFVHYTPKDGLVNSRVKKAYQDSKGRMYFLTYGGLSVYDGARFRNYNTQNGLPINIVNDILEIGNDSMLVATNSANINLLVKGRMEFLKTENNFTPLVNHFYRHNDGKIYLSSDFGLYVLEKNKIHELNVSGVFRRNGQVNLGTIAGIDNYLVLSTNEMSFNKGFYLYDIKSNRICDSMTSIRAYLTGKDGKNRIWLSTSHHLRTIDTVKLKQGKLSVLLPDKGYIQIQNYSTINIALGNNFVWLVYRDKEFRNSELRRIDENGNLLRVNIPGQMTASYIQNIFIDRENNIWLSNDGEGVFKIVRSRLQIIEKPFIETGGGQAGYVYYNNGITWFSTIANKLYRNTPGISESFTSNLDQSPYVFYEKGKNILANDARSIYQASFKTRPGYINFQKTISLPDSDYFGNKLIVDPNGVVITSQLSGLGLWLNNKIIGKKPIESREHIEDLFIDNNKKLWVVKRSLGIDVYGLHPENFSDYLHMDFHIPIGDLPGSIRSCMIDKKGLLWIGTRDNGLAGYEIKQTRVIKLFHFTTENGLSDNFVTSLACDSLNNIIAGTQTGLDLILFDPNGVYNIENLSRNSNLFAYINTTWADKDFSYALTNSGVVLKVTTTAMEDKGLPPQLFLEELKINAKTILQMKSSFAFKENNLSFFVAAPSFIDEKQVRYTYLLQGSGNDHWSDTTAANSIINLTNLSSGDYVLKVKAFFHSDAYSPSELSYSFEITPAWWQTWWFRIGMGIVAIALLILGIRFYYRRKLEKQMAVLEKQQAIEKERTRIATDMHDDLGAGLSRIKFLSETIGIKKQQQQGIDEEISSIRNYSHEMIDKMGEIVWALNEKNDSLSDLLSYTRAYTMEYLSQNGIQCRIEMPESFPSLFVSGEFRRNIFLTIKEALHNVVKHSQATEVKLSVSLNHRIAISIQDNGIGFNKNTIRAFSNGLGNMQSRIKELGGSFEILNSDGTDVRIEIPLKK